MIFNRITFKDVFPGIDYDEILKLNKRCQINLSNLALYKTPPEAVDLIKRMLNPNPLERISARDAL